eukprot:3918928-Ditylum_brightwellii.AAC.1
MDIKRLQDISRSDEIKFVAKGGINIDVVKNINSHKTASMQPEKNNNRNQIVSRKKKSTTQAKNEIYTTQFGAHSMQYILKQSDATSCSCRKENRKRKKTTK